MIECTFEHGSKANLRHATCDTIVADENGRVLLTRRGPKLSEAGKWALPGGYVDRDETIEQAALRELREETGWAADDAELFVVHDNPSRPGDDRQNVTFIFKATATRRVSKDYDSEEVAEIKWFALDELPPDMAFDHGRTLDLYRSAMAGSPPPSVFA